MNQAIPDRATVTVRALDDETYRVVARVVWTGGEVSVEGDPEMVAELNGGIRHPRLGTRIMPSDGYRFLIAVSNQYQSPYLVAVLEEGDISKET